MIVSAATDFELARELVLAHSWNPIAYQILNPGIQHWFSPERDAVIGYVTCSRTRVVAGAPVCSPARTAQVVKEFEADAVRRSERVCYFHVGPRFTLAIEHSAHHSIAAIGAVPFWKPANWNSILKSHASLRYQINRARNKGICVAEMPAQLAAESDDLRDIRRQWLGRKHLPPLHFLIEPDIFGHLQDRRLFVATRNISGSAFATCGPQIVGYLLCSPMPNREGWLFEQWAHAAQSPLGTSELLVHAAMSSFAAEDCRAVTMGMVPLSERVLALGVPGPLWLRSLFRFMRLTANPLYNFKGLEFYKYKFRPDYSEPVFAVVNDGTFHPANVFAIARAFAGSPLQLFAWQTLKKLFQHLVG